MNNIRELALALLDDDHGISKRAFGLLHTAMKASLNCTDIIVAVEATNGRFYLPEDFGYWDV